MAHSNAEALSTEYSQWRFNKDLLHHMKKVTMPFKLKEHPNKKIRHQIQLGRWLMAVQFYSVNQMHSRYHLFPRQPLENGKHRTELEERLCDICEIGDGDAEMLADEILGKIDGFLQSDQQGTAAIAEVPEIHFLEDEHGGQIEIGCFKTPHTQRVKHLVRKYGVESTALVCLRYHYLNLYAGGESGLSITALNAMHEFGGATFEGFASPINCRLLGQSGIRFCSLFHDTDAEFGSLGSFFGIDLVEHPGGWILNPPFVEPVLEAMALKVGECLSRNEAKSHWFYITLPLWPDCEAWQILDRSTYKVAYIDIERETFTQQDCYGKCYSTKASLCLFVLGHPPEDVDLIQLRDRICSTDTDAVARDWLDACQQL